MRACFKGVKTNEIQKCFWVAKHTSWACVFRHPKAKITLYANQISVLGWTSCQAS
jgi:hypothetical protein